MKNSTAQYSCFKANPFLDYLNCQKHLKYIIVLFLIVFSFLQTCHCGNTLPITWNYHPTLIQCGKYIVTYRSSSPHTLTITFNQLKNPTTRYKPALGLNDLSYLFTYNVRAFIGVVSNTPTPTAFTFIFYGLTANPKLTRFTINYLAVSNDLIDFFIWINLGFVNGPFQINSTYSYTTTQTLSQALPSTSNINTVISISYLDLKILQATSNLFDQHFTVNILNTTHYNWTLSTLSANTYVLYPTIYVIFYQKVSINLHQQALFIPFSFSWSSAYNSTAQIVYPSNLTDSFEVNVDNSFFGLSGISSILSADFTLTYPTTFSMSLAFNKTNAVALSIFVFRQSPTCPPYYALNLVQSVCVCNDVDCYEGVGCASVIASGINTDCLFCSIIDNFLLELNGSCICKTGYQLSYNNTCQQKCGDGIKFNDQCDDGNNINGDGCSSQCMIQTGFQCSQDFSGTSVCLFKQNICFTLTTTQKNDDNSAIFTFQTTQSSLPLSFQINSFQVRKTLNFTVLRNDQTNCNVNYSINKIYDQTVQILVNFQQTIEGYTAIVDFNFNNTNYLSQDCTLNIVCKGTEMPLIASKYTKQYQIIVKINLVLMFVLGIIFIISMLAPKWIGVQSMQINQLIFFSQLLITDASNWPVAFSVFKYFKYANGYNNIFSDYIVQTFSNNSKKWNYLYFQPAFILNFSVNFVLVLLFVILFFAFQPKKKEGKKHQKHQLEIKNANKIKDQQSVSNQSKTQRRFYQIFINVGIWSLLQFLASIISQSDLLRNPFNKYDFIVPLQINGILMLASFFLIIFVICNIIASIILSQQTIKVLKNKPQLQTYKGVNIIYHFLIGASMFCFNSFTLKNVPVSILFFVAEILYIIFICRLRPYKQCVWIHSVGFIFNRFGYLIFLGFITIKNLFINLNEIIMLVMCYFVIAFVFIMILLSIVRLYYDLRFGEEYEKNMEDIRKEKQLGEKLRNKQKQQYQIEDIRQKVLKNHQKNDSRQMRDKNKYRIERIVLQEKQIELLQFLEKKNWSKLQKEKYYYQKYAQKPLIWLQRHDIKEYQIRMNQMHQKDKMKEKKKLSEKDQINKNELQRFKKERRQELKEKKQRKQIKKENRKKSQI